MHDSVKNKRMKGRRRAPDDQEAMGGSPGDISEESVMKQKRKMDWRMSCDVGEATEGLEN